MSQYATFIKSVEVGAAAVLGLAVGFILGFAGCIWVMSEPLGR